MTVFTFDWFDAVYRGEGPFAFPPWDIGVPQPEFVRLCDAGHLRGETVFDAGCGTGDLAIHLAERGFDVVGCDVAPHAVDIARRKAQERGARVRFEVADLTDLDRFEPTFDIVVDCGLLHVLQGPARGHYLRALHRIARPPATAYVLSLSDAAPRFGPPGISRDVLAADLADAAWQVDAVEPATLVERIPNRAVGEILHADVGQLVEVPAWLASARRTA